MLDSNEQQQPPTKHIRVKVGKKWLFEATMTEETSERTTTYDVKSIKIAGVLITATTMTLVFWALQYAVDLYDLVMSLFE